MKHKGRTVGAYGYDPVASTAKAIAARIMNENRKTEPLLAVVPPRVIEQPSNLARERHAALRRSAFARRASVAIFAVLVLVVVAFIL